MRRASAEELAEVEAITAAVVCALKDHNTNLVILTLARLLPMFWCTNRRFVTATDALDMWRALNVDMEDTIRRVFGDMRYGDRA